MKPFNEISRSRTPINFLTVMHVWFQFQKAAFSKPNFECKIFRQSRNKLTAERFQSHASHFHLITVLAVGKLTYQYLWSIGNHVIQFHEKTFSLNI